MAIVTSGKRWSCLILVASITVGSGGGLAQPAGNDDRVAKRYEELLRANPTEGAALDQLWKRYQDRSATEALLKRWQAFAEAGGVEEKLIYAHLLRRSGQEAAGAYEEVVRMDPGNLPARLAIASIREGTGDLNGAGNILRETLALLPENEPRRAEVALQLGTLLISQGKSQEAGAAFEAALAVRPNDLDLRERLARLYDKNDRFDLAEAEWRKLAAQAPAAKQTEAWREISRLALIRGDFAGATEALEIGLTLISRENWLYRELQAELIHLYQQEGRVAQLEAKWERDVQENPRDLGALLRMVDLYEELADLHRLKDWLTKVVALAPKLRNYRLWLVKVVSDLGEFERAAALMDELLAEQPEKPEYVMARAEIDIQRGNPEQAAVRINAMLRANPTNESISARALEFFLRNRMDDAAERRLVEVAKGENEEAIVALANFYLARRKPDLATEVFKRLDRDSLSSRERATRWARIASLLHDQEQPVNALAALDKAAAFDPSNIEIRLARSELLSQVGSVAEAVNEARTAYGLATTDAARERADERLFQIFQSAREEEREDGIASSGSSRADREFIIGLEEAAEKSSSPLPWMRLAKWQSWARNPKAALDSAMVAVEKYPQSIEAREYLAKTAAEFGRDSLAIDHYEALMEANPSGVRTYQKQVGQILLAGLRYNEAIEIFQRIARENPGSTEALADLASAYERAERWEDARDVLEKALLVQNASESSRLDVMRPLVRVYDHLALHQDAMTLLLKEYDAVADDQQKLALFQLMLDYATKQNLVEVVEKALSIRLKRNPGDHRLMAALAALERSRGKQREAFQYLVRAQYHAPSQANSLESLVRAAEDIGDLDAAIRYQRRLAMSDEKPNAEHLERLARFEEQRFDYDAAARTWQQIVSRFPRDPGVLTAAAEFYDRADRPERAREIFRQIRGLDPSDASLAYRLSVIEAQLGHPGEAARILEQVIALEHPGPLTKPLRLVDLDRPDASQEEERESSGMDFGGRRLVMDVRGRQMRLVAGTSADAAGEPVSLRLAAIRELGRILARPGFERQRNDWIARWQKVTDADSSEALWAFYYCGAWKEALDFLDNASEKTRATRDYKSAYPAIATQARDFQRLSMWLQGLSSDPASFKAGLVAALNAFTLYPLSAEDRERAIAAIFPESFSSQSTLREAAKLLAEEGYFGISIALGKRVLASSFANRAEVARDLAAWMDAAGHRDEAAEMLKIARTGELDYFNSPAIDALYESYRTLPREDRDEWVKSEVAELRRQSGQPLALFSEALLLGLHGQMEEAASALDTLYDQRFGGSRYEAYGEKEEPVRTFWQSIVVAGVHLEQLGLGDLAIPLWERALNEGALVAYGGPDAAVFQQDIRARLWVLKIAKATEVGLGEAMATECAAGSPEIARQAASFLSDRGYHREAAVIRTDVKDPEHENEEAWRSLEADLRSSYQLDDAAGLAGSRLDPSVPLPAGNSRMDVISGLIDTLRLQNRSGLILGILRIIYENDPSDSEAAMILADEYRAQHRLEKAVEIYRELIRRNPAKIGTMIACAEALMDLGDWDGGIKIAEDALNADPLLKENAAPHLVVWYVRAGKTDRALALARRLIQSGQDRFLPDLAIELAKMGQRSTAVSVMRVFEEKVGSTGFNDQRRFFRSAFSGGQDPAGAAVELQRLSRMAGSDPSMRHEMYQEKVAYAQARNELPALREEFQRAWNQGHGDWPVAVALFRVLLALDAVKEADDLARVFLSMESIGAETLQQLADTCRERGHPGLEALLLRKLVRLAPHVPAHQRALAEALWTLGKQDEARAIASQLRRFAALKPEDLQSIATLFHRFGDLSSAIDCLTEARSSTTTRDPDIENEYIELLIESGDLRKARSVLAKALRNSANRGAKTIALYLDRAGLADNAPAELAALEVDRTLRMDVLERIFNLALQTSNFDRAYRLAAANPRLVLARPDILEGLTDSAIKNSRYEEVAAILQAAVSFAATGRAFLLPPFANQWSERDENLLIDALDREARRNLSRVLSAWADATISEDNETRALRILERANSIWPSNAEAAHRLAELYTSRGNATAAAAVLGRLAAAAESSAVRERALKGIRALEKGKSPAAKTGPEFRG